mmetsp:Transcript_17180/g.38689  ORF Transcript_17180/g.38689 Transcript_17180/m.38689 type:complete len:169 (-) Transcript_17180:677-1183(-)
MRRCDRAKTCVRRSAAHRGRRSERTSDGTIRLKNAHLLRTFEEYGGVSRAIVSLPLRCDPSRASHSDSPRPPRREIDRRRILQPSYAPWISAIPRLSSRDTDERGGAMAERSAGWWTDAIGPLSTGSGEVRPAWRAEGPERWRRFSWDVLFSTTTCANDRGTTRCCPW